MNNTKICKIVHKDGTIEGCGLEKALSEFQYRKENGKHRSLCNLCLSEYRKKRYSPEYWSAYNIKNKKRVNNSSRKNSHRNILEKKGLTEQEISDMYDKQNGKCAICEIAIQKWGEGKNKDKACIDHNHQTNKIRGLLCASCNLGIGELKEDTKILENAIKYLKEHEEKNI